jgi:hypothetical protein
MRPISPPIREHLDADTVAAIQKTLTMKDAERDTEANAYSLAAGAGDREGLAGRAGAGAG